ncbi:MAG: CRISPR-associated helicase Cas3' [Clostridia bacterium]|nr:CRISPR-associated helicase Cas3' [Clostridia bacterium]
MINKEQFLAKSDLNPEGCEETIQSHTERLLQLLDDFKECNESRVSTGNLELIAQAAYYHDLGKMNTAFQSFIYQQKGETPPMELNKSPIYGRLGIRDIPHGFLSAAFVPSEWYKSQGSCGKDDLKVLITAICRHHNRDIQPDRIGERNGIIRSVSEEDLKPIAAVYDETLKVRNNTIYDMLATSNNDNLPRLWTRYAIVKGLLNKLDYAASAYEGVTEMPASDAEENVKKHFERQGYVLNPCQAYAKSVSGKNTVITASTGMGKTEAALLWIGKRKGFYTLPFKVSLNAIYKRIKDNNYYPEYSTILLHSGALEFLANEEAEQDQSFESAVKKYENAKQLSFPLTVCTIDQLFAFAYRAKGSELIAATLSYSALVIDEIQSYSPDIVAKLLYGLELLHKLGGIFMIMTATLPPFIADALSAKDIPFDRPAPFFTQTVRHRVTLKDGDFNYEEITAAALNKQVLVLCNTVSKAVEVYKKIAESTDKVNLLHSRFIAADRAKKELDITSLTKDKTKHGIWIATQLVEASLDIDFDILYTEMSTADSLIQRMGRCFRGRAYSAEAPNIIVYNTKNTAGGRIYDNEIYDRSVKYLSEYTEKPFTEADKQAYIEQVFATDGIKKTEYYKRFENTYRVMSEMDSAYFDASEARRRLRGIEDTICVIPFNLHEEAYQITQEIDKLTSKINALSRLSAKLPQKDQAAMRNISYLKRCKSDYIRTLRRLTVSVNRYSRGLSLSKKEPIYDCYFSNNYYSNVTGLDAVGETGEFI